MEIDSAVEQIHHIDNRENKILENQSDKVSGKTPFIANPALYLIENFSQAISKIYHEMGVGNHIDYDA